jgi:hypothetical protein
MTRRLVTDKTLAQLHTSIQIDAEGALATVRRLIEPAPFSDRALVSVETDLVRILEAAEQAEKLERQITRTLAGPWLAEADSC